MGFMIGLGTFNRGLGYYLAYRGRDIGEGPWDTLAEAEHFFDAEVGVPCRIYQITVDGKVATISPEMWPHESRRP